MRNTFAVYAPGKYKGGLYFVCFLNYYPLKKPNMRASLLGNGPLFGSDSKKGLQKSSRSFQDTFLHKFLLCFDL